MVKDIESVLIIGSGPIAIGQACEFDYSGSQAAKALKEEGYRVILINSNPATIMTDPEMADATYIEPLTRKFIEEIIIKEKPNVILPTLGGQTALNLAMELHREGLLDKYKVKMIGASPEAIEKAENRWAFKEAMEKEGITTLKAGYVKSIEEGVIAGNEIGYPLMLRPSYVLGGEGTSIVEDRGELEAKLNSAFEMSPTQGVLIEESVYGWKEFELEIMRDIEGNAVVVCGIENMDPMGVHTGDSITVSPIQTLSDQEFQEMRDAALKCLDVIGIATGGSNVQFAINPMNGDMRIIEMNPRVSRSSALASKATGFPIAKIAALLAVGNTLTEIANDITGSTPASFEPVQDYVVVKIPRFDFPKFTSTDDALGTSMQSIGEVMAIAGTFNESLTKAIRSLEIGKTGILEVDDRLSHLDKEELEVEIETPRPTRLFAIFEAIRRGWSIEQISNLSHVDKWFLEEIDRSFSVELNDTPPSILKSLGWVEDDVETQKLKDDLSLQRVYKLVDTCSSEFESKTPYFYSTNGFSDDEGISNRKKVVVIGSGPNRIGQGVEFDYCCVHGVNALKENEIEAIMINSNPGTVSTDYDTSDKLYFEPLSGSEVESVLKREQPDSVIIQLGGQTPLKLAKQIHEAGYKIAGSSLGVIEQTEDRNLFFKLCKEEMINQPVSKIANNQEELILAVKKIGYPILLRPSYVLGGRGMRIITNENELNTYLDILSETDAEGNPFNSGSLLVDEYLTDSIEVDVDLISDGKEVFIAGVLEHLEPAGVHSGDSTAIIPPYSLSSKQIEEIEAKSKALTLRLGVKGLLNIQFAIKEGVLYILEANPRASRTMPFVSKVTQNQIIKAGTLLMIGLSLEEIKENTDYLNKKQNGVAVKMAIFPWTRLPEEDTLLGPEMKATGEVLGSGKNLGIALAKAYIAADFDLDRPKSVLVTLSDEDKPKFKEVIEELEKREYKIYATKGTAEYLSSIEINSTVVGRTDDKVPSSLSIIQDNLISLIINTPPLLTEYSDGWLMRREAHNHRIPIASSVRVVEAFLEAYNSRNDILEDIRAIQGVR